MKLKTYCRSAKTLKLGTLPILLILLILSKFPSAFGQGPTNNLRPSVVALMTDTNGVLKAPTNFFAANSNLFNASVGPGSGAQPANANLTNWSQILTNILLNFQAASANLTNLSALSTNILAQTNDTRVLKLTNSANTFGGNGAALTSLTAANLTGSLPAISGAALTSLTAANLSGQVAVANGGTGKTTATNAAQAIAVFPMSPAGGNNANTDYLNAAPGYEGQLGNAWFGNHKYALFASGSTTQGDWIHTLNFPTGVGSIGSSNLMDVDYSNPHLLINLNGSSVGWTNSGDGLVIVQNWSTNRTQSGGGFGIAVMGATNATGPANAANATYLVGCAFVHVPSNRTNYLWPGTASLVFNEDDTNLKGFGIGGPSLPGYSTGTNAIDSGNYALTFFDLKNKQFRVPIWHPNFAFQPSDTGWNDLFVADPKNANVKMNGNVYIGGTQWNSTIGGTSNLFNQTIGDPNTRVTATNFLGTGPTSFIDLVANATGLWGANYALVEKANGVIFLTLDPSGSTTGVNPGFNTAYTGSGIPYGFGLVPRSNVSIEAQSNIVTRATLIANAVSVTNAITHEDALGRDEFGMSGQRVRVHGWRTVRVGKKSGADRRKRPGWSGGLTRRVPGREGHRPAPARDARRGRAEREGPLSFSGNRPPTCAS